MTQTLPESLWIKIRPTANKQVENHLFAEIFPQPPAIKTPSVSQSNQLTFHLIRLILQFSASTEEQNIGLLDLMNAKLSKHGI